MKYCITILLGLVLLACASDRSNILGKWYLFEIYENNELSISSDPSKLKEIINIRKKSLQENELAKALGMDNSVNVIQEVSKQINQLKERGFEFTSNYFFEFKTGDTKRKKEYRLNEDKKVIEVLRDQKVDEQVPYSLENNQLSITIGNTKIVMVRNF